MWKVLGSAALVGIFGCNVSTQGTGTGVDDGTPTSPTTANSGSASAPPTNPTAPAPSKLVTSRLEGDNCVLTFALADVGVVAPSSAPWSVDGNPFLATAMGSHSQDDLVAALPLQFRIPLGSNDQVTRVSLVMSRQADGPNDVHDGLVSHGAGVRFGVGTAPLVAATWREGSSTWPKSSLQWVRYTLDRLALKAADGTMSVAASVECRIEQDSQAKLAAPQLEVTVTGRASCP